MIPPKNGGKELQKAFEDLKKFRGKTKPERSKRGLGADEDQVVAGVVEAFQTFLSYKPDEITFADTRKRQRGRDIIGHRVDYSGNEEWWLIEAKGEPKKKGRSIPSLDTAFTQLLGQLLANVLKDGPGERFKISYGIAVPYTYYYTQRCDQVASDAPMLRWHWFYVSSEGRLIQVKEPEGCTCLQPLEMHGVRVLSSDQSASDKAPGRPIKSKKKKKKR